MNLLNLAEPREPPEPTVTRFYLTTAIDYVNSRPHLGTAYEKIAADVIARYKRLAGFDVHFVMGNDEHSQNVFRKAKELGEEPLAYCDRMAGEFLDVWRRLDLSFDDFIRTTEPRHRAGVQDLIRRITAAGDIYEGDYEGLVLRVVRGLQAGEGPRRGPVRDPSHQAGLDPREESLLPPVEVSGAAAEALRRASRVPDPRGSPQRDSAADRGGPRRHLRQPRGAGLGHPDAAGSVERRLRVVRRAHQLHLGSRPGHRRGDGWRDGGPPTCT